MEAVRAGRRRRAEARHARLVARVLAPQRAEYQALQTRSLAEAEGVSLTEASRMAELKAGLVGRQLFLVNVRYRAVVGFRAWTSSSHWVEVASTDEGFLGAWFHAIDYQIRCDATLPVLLKWAADPATGRRELLSWLQGSARGQRYLADLQAADSRVTAAFVARAQWNEFLRVVPPGARPLLEESALDLGSLEPFLKSAPSVVVGLDATRWRGRV